MKSFILTTIMATAALAASAQTEADSVLLAGSDSPLMPQKSLYTLTLRNVQLNGADKKVEIKIRTGANGSGANITVGDKEIVMSNAKDTIRVAEMLIDGLDKHDYTITKSSKINLYRDGAQVGTIGYSNFKDGNRIVLDGVSAVQTGYALELTADGSVEEPEQETYENHLDNLLKGFSNLAADPYFNSGLSRSGDGAEARGHVFLNSCNAGQGSSIWIDNTQAYSGATCVAMSSQAGETSPTTLEQEVKLKANVPYIVRAMVKSLEWEGRLGIKGLDNAIHIKDTKGEWKQVEGVLSSQNAATTIELAHDPDGNGGTVYIDNLEIYEGSNNTSGIKDNKAVMVSVGAGNTWSPTNETSVYRIKLTEKDAETYAQIDMEKVQVTGAPLFTRSFTGSKMEAIYFPYAVGSVTATGTWDYRNFYEYPLYNGLDFVMQRFNPQTGRFEYLDDDAELTAGAYIIQVADNYEGQAITFDFDPSKPDTAEDNGAYRIAGNGSCADVTVEIDAWKEYHFNADKEVFDQNGSTGSNAKKTRPFLYYIYTLEENAPSVIAPDGVNGIQRLTAAKGGNAFTVRPVAGGAEIVSRTRGTLPVYSLAGTRVKNVAVENGVNTVSLPAGFYIVAGKKVIVK